MKRKNNFETDLDGTFTWDQVKVVLEVFELDEKEFSDWISTRTCPAIHVDGRREVGFYGRDIWKFINQAGKV